MEIITRELGFIYYPRTPFAHRALQNINLTIRGEQLVALVGRTGSGKSTLIQHFNGLLKPTEGSLKVGRHQITAGQRKSPVLYHSVGLLFQYPEHQLFEATVAQDIAFGPRNLNWPEELIQWGVREALEWVGLPLTYLSRSPIELSGGEKRRVALAGVLVMQPDLLILDEPTVGLDPQGQQQILQLLSSWKEEAGKTVLLVTHQMEHVAEYADEVIVLAQGEVHLTCTPLELFLHHNHELDHIGLDLPPLIRLVKGLNRRLSQPLMLSSTKRHQVLEAIVRTVKGGGLG